MLEWAYHILQWTWGGYRFKSGAAGYNIFSGPLPDITFLGIGYGLYRKHNCHVNWCPRLQWHTHPEHGHPVCKHHHNLPATEDLK